MAAPISGHHVCESPLQAVGSVSDDQSDCCVFGSCLNEFEPSPEREWKRRSDDLKLSPSDAVAEQQAGVVVVVVT